MAAVGGWFFAASDRSPKTSTYMNSVLAIRGFRHAAKSVSTGEAATYELNVGEEAKITWKVENAREDGQIIYRGPAGIGTGLVPVPWDAPASPSAAPFLAFTPQAPGTAQFSLTTTGPGPDGIYTLTSVLTVTIK